MRSKIFFKEIHREEKVYDLRVIVMVEYVIYLSTLLVFTFKLKLHYSI